MKYNKLVRLWLLLGLFMLFIQIVVGGITRLTGSGLSITKWEIITGTLPPLSDNQWEEEFELYKLTPQYEKINEGMEMGTIFESGTFKFIYFWEYLHRLWARLMGFVFLFPFIGFLLLKFIDKALIKYLLSVILLAVLAASFGWIMVASGLINRPWVNAYKLALHLCIGFSVYAAMLWTCFYGFAIEKIKSSFSKAALTFTILVSIQIFFGGVMSGMKAGLFYPTWPDMNGSFIPSIIFQLEEYTLENFNQYDKNLLLPALIQTIHRLVAYLLFFMGLRLGYLLLKESKLQSWKPVILMVILLSQVILGIVTVINCKGNIPVGLGVLHQAFGLALLSVSLFINYTIKAR